MRNRIIGSVSTVAILLALLAAGPASAGQNAILCVQTGRAAGGRAPQDSGPQAPAASIVPQPGQAYIHTSTNASLTVDPSVCDSTYLENPALNGQPRTKFFTVENSMPYGYGQLHDHPLGIWYDQTPHRWAIFNDDQFPMNVQQSFNVFIPPQDSTVVLHTSTGPNTAGPLTDIVAPQFFENPDAVIFVQHVYNPGSPAAGDAPMGSVVDYYTRTVAVTYDTSTHYWAIRNADGSNFPLGKTFYALKASADETFFTHTVTAGSLAFGYATTLDNPLLNDNPDAEVLVTQNYDTGLANNHRVGVGYYAPSQRWYIFQQDVAPMPVGLRFNVLVIPPKTGFFYQTATPGNTTLNVTAIDNPDLNNNPDALIYVEHNWNPPGLTGGIYHDHPIGVQYLGGSWYVINADGAPMQAGVTFNVYYTLPRGNSFSVSASGTNTSGAYMNTNSPLLNSNPDAVPIASYNASPAGLVGGVYTLPVGLRYYNPLSDWQIFNDLGPTFSITQTYNVLVAPSSFVVTATAPIGDGFVIDNPLTNGNPQAMIFASPRDNGGINQKNTGVYYISLSQRWAIFNEDRTLMATNVVYDVFVSPLRLYLPVVVK